jgi:RNA-binding protein YlmH
VAGLKLGRDLVLGLHRSQVGDILDLDREAFSFQMINPTAAATSGR